MFISSLASSSKSFFFHEVFLYRKYLESSFYIFYADDVKLISCWVIDSGNIAIIRFQCLETAKNHFDVVECKWAMFILCCITGSPGLQKIAQTVHWSFFTLHACSQCSMRCAFQWNLFKYISKVIMRCSGMFCFVFFLWGSTFGDIQLPHKQPEMPVFLRQQYTWPSAHHSNKTEWQLHWCMVDTESALISSLTETKAEHEEEELPSACPAVYCKIKRAKVKDHTVLKLKI